METVVAVLICPDTPEVVTVVHCLLCKKSFAAADGVRQRGALMMLASHLRTDHEIDVRTERFDVDEGGVRREVRLYR